MVENNFDDLSRRFAADYAELVDRYFGELEPEDYESFGLKVREALPQLDFGPPNKPPTGTLSIIPPGDSDTDIPL